MLHVELLKVETCHRHRDGFQAFGGCRRSLIISASRNPTSAKTRSNPGQAFVAITNFYGVITNVSI